LICFYRLEKGNKNNILFPPISSCVRTGLLMVLRVVKRKLRNA